MGSYLNGSVLTETIFGWDGIGRYAMTAILKHDYPVILGTVLQPARGRVLRGDRSEGRAGGTARTDLIFSASELWREFK